MLDAVQLVRFKVVDCRKEKKIMAKMGLNDIKYIIFHINIIRKIVELEYDDIVRFNRVLMKG